MATGTTNVRRFGRLLPSAARARGYGRALLLSLIAAGGLAGLATLASQLTVTTGTILLFGLGGSGISGSRDGAGLPGWGADRALRRRSPV
jgi:hypothetical protein